MAPKPKKDKKEKVKKYKNPYEAFLPRAKKTFIPEREFPTVSPKTLNESQLKVYNAVSDHIKSKSSDPFRLIVHGESGSGKSYITQALRKLFESKRIEYKVCAPTGLAAWQVRGETIHFCFRLPFGNQTAYTKDALVYAEDTSLEEVEWLILDEMSMVGLSLLGMIASRLQSINENFTDPLGGLNCILMGDVKQLECIRDKPLYSKDLEGLSPIESLGHKAYMTFDKSVCLNSTIRQKDDDGFRDILNRVRNGCVTEEDCKILSTRQASYISEEERKKFMDSDTVFLFAEVQNVNLYNESKLGTLGTEIISLPGMYSNTNGEKEPTVLRVAVGAKVILQNNAWVQASLFNGSVGIVRGWSAIDKTTGLPSCLFIHFPGYVGPPYLMSDSIPITPISVVVTNQETGDTIRSLRFPVMLAYAITIHRSQGSTLSRTVINIPGPVEEKRSMIFKSMPSLLYVALSRAKSLNDVLFNRPFRMDLANNISKRHADKNEEENRIKEMEIE